MTTLSENARRSVSSGGNRNHLPAIGSDIIYEGAAVGLVAATGYARPLVGGDRFGGFATSKCDNSTGSAGDKEVETYRRGTATLSVSGAVITDVGQPVYATDDDTFVFLPVGGTFVGYVSRFVSSGVVEVEFDVNWEDPYGGGVYEEITGNKTLDVEDTGKTFFVTADATTTTIPATATALRAKVVNLGAFGTVAVNLSPQAADQVEGPDLSGADDKDLINTKATARRGDYAVITNGATAGPRVDELVGTWAAEA